MFRRSHWNLARWLTLCMGSILVTFGSIAYYTEVMDELRRLDRSLYRQATVMVAGLSYRFEESEWLLNLDYVPLLGHSTLPVESTLIYARWYDPTGTLIQFLGSPTLDHLTHEAGFETLVLGEVEHGVEIPRLSSFKEFETLSIRQLTLPIYHGTEPLGYLQIAQPLQSVQENLAALRLFLAFILPAALGVIAFVSWYFGRLAMQPLEEAHRQLERFTSDASHELRAPLAAILSNAQVGLLASPDSEQRYRLQNIVDTTKSLNSLVTQLLILARHAGAIAPQHLSSLDLGEWLPLVASRYRSQAQARSLTLTLDMPKGSLWVRANPELLAQAIANLLINAIKYTPPNGQVTLHLSQEANRAVIEVADTGVGIAAADLPHIFDRFYRVDSGRSPQTGGFGLGLAIAQQIIHAHSGTLTARSSTNLGSIFQITLPLDHPLPPKEISA